MEDISNKSNVELLALVDETEDKEVLRYIANELEVSFSGNTGVGTLKAKVAEALEAKIAAETETGPDENDPVVQALNSAPEVKPAPPETLEESKDIPILERSRAVLAMMDPYQPGLTTAEQRAIVRAKAMRLHRVRVHNLDPNDSALPGAIKTVYNKFTGKVSKFIPFGEENEQGYHVPEILLNALREEKYPMRKEIKQRGQVSSFGVKQYKTVLMPKFNIEVLPPLTEVEIESLAKDQKARGAIDNAA